MMVAIFNSVIETLVFGMNKMMLIKFQFWILWSCPKSFLISSGGREAVNSFVSLPLQVPKSACFA